MSDKPSAMQQLVRRLINRVKRVERDKVSWQQAVVTDNDPLTVKLSGSEVPIRVSGIDGLAYDVNDVVTVLVRDTDMLALSRAVGSPGGGTSYAAGDGLALAAGVFSLDLKSGGGLKITSGELAADFGSGAGKVTEGNDSRLSDQRTPTDGSVTAAKVASSLKPSGSAAGTDESLRRLGTGSTHAAAGDDSRFPSTGEKNALAGTSGTPGSGNKFVTNSDGRLSDARTPTAHAASHKDGGSDELKLHELGEPTADVTLANHELIHVADGTEGDSAVNLGQLQLTMAGFTVRPQADYATVQSLDSYTGTGTGILEASSNGDLLDALGLESENWGYDRTFNYFMTPYAIARDSSGNLFVTCKNRLSDVYQVAKFNSSGVYQSAFGANGSGNGQFGGPCYGICVDSSNNVYVADQSNNRIQKFNSSGTYLAQVGSSGSGNGQFAYPQGIAIDSSNNIFVADTVNNRIQKFNSSLTYQSKFGSAGSGNGAFASPAGIAIDSSNNIFVADCYNYRVQKFNSSGTYQAQFGSFGSGNGQFNFPWGICVDSSNNIFVADYYNYRVQKFNSSGTYQAQFGSMGGAHGQFNAPAGLAVDGSGNLFVCDIGNNRVEKFLYFAASSVAVNQDIIVKDQAFGGPHVDHGVYTIKATGGVSSKWKLQRRDDLDTSAEVPSGLLVAARRSGPITPGGMYYISTADPITLDTTPIVWEEFKPGGFPDPHAFTHGLDGTDPLVDQVEDWIEIGSGGSAPAFNNGWVNYGGTDNPTAAFYKDPFGTVHLKGWVKSGTIGSSAFSLPVGYRPAEHGEYIVYSNTAISGRVNIYNTGGVTPNTPSNNSRVSLDGITFRAAA